MSRRRRPTRSVIVALGALLCVAPARAEESDAPPPVTTDVVAGCVNAHEKARLSILNEDWASAQQAVADCAAAACPLAIRSDCGSWQEDVEKALPTLLVVVERKPGGAPVTLLLDGRLIELPQQSAPIQTLPGKHELVFNLPPFAPIAQELTLVKGEKNHMVSVRFGADESPAPAEPRAPAMRSSRPVPWSTLALSGGALVAFATSTGFLVSALSKRADARAECAPVCGPSVTSAIESRLLLADLSGGAGVVLAGLAAYTYWKRPVLRERVGLALPDVALDRQAISVRLAGDF